MAKILQIIVQCYYAELGPKVAARHLVRSKLGAHVPPAPPSSRASNTSSSSLLIKCDKRT